MKITVEGTDCAQVGQIGEKVVIETYSDNLDVYDFGQLLKRLALAWGFAESSVNNIFDKNISEISENEDGRD
jgi:hypothetical protein